METTISNAILSLYNTTPKNIKALGGGFYGRAFLVTIECPPYLLVAKLFLFSGIASKEATQIKELSKHATLKMPEIYHICPAADYGYPYDIIFMEYLEGASAAYVDVKYLQNKTDICNDIIRNLISYHSATNTKGFGELDALKYYPTWQEYYYPIACGIFSKATVLFDKGQLTHDILSVFEKALNNFVQIFYVTIKQPSLIHGDYNTWNIMLTSDCSQAYAAIDPFNCCWGDNEFDLYQLDNANGKEYGLLKRYAEIVPLSENFLQKRCFYELFTEVSHYHDAGMPVNIRAVEILAKKLNALI